MPAADRNDVLDHLETLNINAYSLFGSEDAMMETLARRTLYNLGRTNVVVAD